MESLVLVLVLGLVLVLEAWLPGALVPEALVLLVVQESALALPLPLPLPLPTTPWMSPASLRCGLRAHGSCLA